MKITSNLPQSDKSLISYNNESTMDDQAVLGWQYDMVGNLDMVWRKKPDTNAIEKIVRRELDVPDTVTCTITFLAEGVFNKVYDVRYGSNKHYVMRVAAPVQPQLKTSSEVATIEYVRQHTDVPVPSVIKFDSSHDNELGYEWMLMEHLSGSKLEEQWRSMTWSSKELLVRKVVALLAQLFQQRFPTIGNLYMNNHQQFRQGQNVEFVFFWENHLEFEVARGPFSSSEEWLRASLDVQLQAMDHPADVMPGPYDDSDEEEAHDASRRRATWKKDLGQRLIKLLPTILPADEPQIFTLHHHDLHADNIFVDANHELSGIIDWECMPTVPLWVACEIPKFLQTLRDRDIAPDPNSYSKKILGGSSTGARNDGSMDVPKDGFEDSSDHVPDDAASDHVPDDGPDDGPDHVSDDGSDYVPDDSSEDGSEESSEDSSGDGSDDSFEDSSDDSSEAGSDDASEGGSDDASEDASGDASQDAFQDNSEDDSGAGSEDEPEDGSENGCNNDPGKGSDNGSKDASDDEYEDASVDIYYHCLEEYEKPKLRALFLEEMQRACPEWVDLYRTNKLKAGLAEAVVALGNNWQTYLVNKWINAVEEHGFAPTINEMARAYEQRGLHGEHDGWFDGVMAKAAEEQGIDTYAAGRADT